MRPLHVFLGLRGPVLPAMVETLAEALVTDGDPRPPVIRPATSASPGDPTWVQEGDRVTLRDWQGGAEGRDVFLQADGSVDPRDLLEALPVLLSSEDFRLARIHLVVDLALLEERPRAMMWVSMAAHFADTFLMVRAPGVANKTVSDLAKRLDKECHPGLRRVLVPGEVPPLGEFLVPEARRLTTWFDSLQFGEPELPVGTAWDVDGSPDAMDDDGDDDEDREPLFDRDAIGRRQPPLGEY